MMRLPALYRAFPLAALVVGITLAMTIESADAQQQQRRGDGSDQGLFQKPHRGPAIGGTSWTLSDVWGKPEMPKPSLESPGYNYPPGGYELNGPPSQSPYPN